MDSKDNKWVRKKIHMLNHSDLTIKEVKSKCKYIVPDSISIVCAISVFLTSVVIFCTPPSINSFRFSCITSTPSAYAKISGKRKLKKHESHECIPIGCVPPAAVSIGGGGGGVAFCHGLLLWSSVMPFCYGLLVWWPSD